MKGYFLSLMLLLASGSALGAHDLSEEYRFSADLDPSYKLHWNFDLQAGTIAFAVNVSTTGWVGFGLSPNGQMPGSDVIIGWVESNGQVVFKVSHANIVSLHAVQEFAVTWTRLKIPILHHAGSICHRPLPATS